MIKIENLHEQLEMISKYQKIHSSRDIATLLNYPHFNMERVIKKIIGGRKTDLEYLLTSEEVIRLIMALPEYNGSLVSYTKTYLAHKLSSLARR
jgi:hypothetical protein